MKTTLAAFLIVAAATTASCDGVGAPKAIPYAEARADLMTFTGGGRAQTLCSKEGRREFRRAVRTFSAAAEATGQSPPPLGRASEDDAWKLVVMGVVARVVEPSDLRGHAKLLPILSALPTADQEFGDARAAFDVACPELMKFYSEAAALAELSAGAKSRKELSESQRRDYLEQVRSRALRYEAAKKALERRLRAAGWVSTNGQGLRRP